jgi:hypothetical protein
MAEKNTGKGRKSTGNHGGGHRSHDNDEGGLGFNLSGAKMERLYDVLEAFIDTLDMPRNKGRAIKYGIRAIGEFMTPEDGSTGGRRGNGGGSTRASLADDEQSEGSSTSRRG